MKNLFFIFLFTFAFCNDITAQIKWEVIGKIDNGVPILTINKAEVLKAFNANLYAASKIDGKFTDVTILSTNDGNYLMVFKGSLYKASLFVRKQSTRLEALTTTSCTTSSCSTEPRGCVVMYDGDDIGYCSPCGNGGGCTKTSTGTSLIKSFN